MTATAVLTLALGISATSTIFSWIGSTLLDPIPGASHTGSLVAIGKGERNESPMPPVSYPDFLDLRHRTRSFSDILAYHDDWVSMTESGRPERLYAALVSTNYFDLLRANPILGRGFQPQEEAVVGRAPVAVISDGLWRSRYGASDSVLGRAIEINHERYTIVGVAPRHFRGCKTGIRTDVWIPLAMDSAVWGGARFGRRDVDWLNLLGRLRSGRSGQQAQQDLNLAMQRLAAEYPDSHRGPHDMWVEPLWRSPFGANVFLYRGLALLFAMAIVVLLLACANVANLLVVRSIARRREVAIRLSMGARRWHLVRQMLLESLLLALAGGIVAALFTVWTAGAFAGFLPPTGHPLDLNGRLDGTVLAAILLFSVLTCLVSGALPALHASGVNASAVLKDESVRGSGGVWTTRLSGALVVLQVALSLLLLVSAGLFVRSLQHAAHMDVGFDPMGVVIAAVEPPADGSSQGSRTFERQLLDTLRSVPGIESAALSDWVPLTFTKSTSWIQPEGYVPRLHESMDLRRAIVSPEYFRTMRIPMLAGRAFDDRDSAESRPVAVVDEELARRYWSGQDALGRRFQTDGRWFTVVGVARTIRHHRLNEPPEPMFYLPTFQVRGGGLIVHVRTSRDAASAVAAIDRAVHELQPDLPVFNAATLSGAMRMASTFERLAATLSSAFGLIALALASVGIYGVLSCATRRRTREIGIRVALGARRSDVFRLILSDGLWLTVPGLAVGLVASLALTRGLRGMLVGIEETDVATYVAVTGLLLLVGAAACAIPALRAMAVQPNVALRHE